MYQPITKLTPDLLRLFLKMAGWHRAPKEDVGDWEAWGDQRGNFVSVATDPNSPYQEDFLWEALEFVMSCNFHCSSYRQKYDFLINFGKTLEAARNAND